MTDARGNKWVTLAVVVLGVLIVTLDTTVITTALPTILREFHTELPSLQWVLTGYSLTFATFLVIGGRVGDVYGARRTFVVGAVLFAAGSFLASVSTSVPMLLLGESLIEGVGAALMVPSTLGILSNTFQGPERSRAFSIWGATAGSSVAFGPVIGGWLTTAYSWRWAFRLNLVVAPLAIVGALLFVAAPPRGERRPRIDVVGALLIALGTFLLVFTLSEGVTYGWWTPRRDLTVLGATAWPVGAPISAIPVLCVVAVVVLVGLVRWERSRERADRDPLFELSLLEHPSFRYGLLTMLTLALAQLGYFYVMPVVLQDGRGLSPFESGAWVVPSGLLIMVGSQVGASLVPRFGVTWVVRTGFVLECLGLAAMALAMNPDFGFLDLLLTSAPFGVGVGFASSQLTNVVLSDIPPAHAGAAGGANTTVRQIASALGIAIVGMLLTSRSTASALHQLDVADVGTSFRAAAQAGVRGLGATFQPAGGAADVATLDTIRSTALADGARPALGFAAAVVAVGVAVSFLLPKTRPHAPVDEPLAADELLEVL